MPFSQIIVLDPSCYLQTQSGVGVQIPTTDVCICSSGEESLLLPTFLLCLPPLTLPLREGYPDLEPGSQANVSWDFPSRGPTPRGGVHSRTS